MQATNRALAAQTKLRRQLARRLDYSSTSTDEFIILAKDIGGDEFYFLYGGGFFI